MPRLEVNASPSLSTTTEEDRMLKLRLMHDTFNIVEKQKIRDAALHGYGQYYSTSVRAGSAPNRVGP